MHAWKWEDNEDLEGSLKLISGHAPSRRKQLASNWQAILYPRLFLILG